MHASILALLPALAASATPPPLTPDPASELASRAAVVHLGSAPYPGRLNAHPATGIVALGRVGPGTGSHYLARTLNPDSGAVASAGSRTIPDPDSAAWDLAGRIAAPGSILIGGVQGIHSVAPSGAVRVAIAPNTWLRNPEDIRFDAQGNLIVADFTNATLWRYDPGAGLATPLAVFPRGILQFDLDTDGAAHVVHPSGGIARVAPSGGIDHIRGAAYYTGIARTPDHAGWPRGSIACELTTGDLVLLRDDGTDERLFIGLFAPVTPGPTIVPPTEAELTFLPSGRLLIALVDTGDLYTVHDPCGRQDANGDGRMTPADFSMWIARYTAGHPAADTNFDGQLTPADLTAWIAGWSACPRW
jgi:hypothetical protein